MFGFLTGGFKFIKWALVIGFFAVLGFLGWQYHKGTQGRIDQLLAANQVLISNNATLEQNNSTLKEGIDAANNTVTRLEETYERIRQDYDELQGEFQVIRLQNDELANRLGRHELDVLAARKPALVENVINNATKAAFRCFELQSGAPLTESERNAKTDREFNSECPWLFGAVGGN